MSDTAAASPAYIADLRSAVAGEVAADPTARTVFSQDASNYRQVPAAVAFPTSAEDLRAIRDVCATNGVPIVARGAGTSIAGQALGTGVVVDCSRHMNRILDIDPDAGTARVQPGVVLDRLQEAAASHGLRFGPDPSTHSRCTIGGMIGNDACGSHSVRWGRTADNVVALDVLTGDGTPLTVRADAHPDGAHLGGRHGDRAVRMRTQLSQI